MTQKPLTLPIRFYSLLILLLFAQFTPGCGSSGGGDEGDADLAEDVLDLDGAGDAEDMAGDVPLLCGTSPCENGESCCDYECRDLSSDANHCGACGNTCEGTEACTDGVCRCGEPACGSSEACCDLGDDQPACIEVLSNPQHCGVCGRSCEATERCLNGTCACQAGDGTWEQCGDSEVCCPGVGCRDLKRDATNCGVCGNACGAGELCDSGTCACGNLTSTGSGSACAAGESCCGSPAVCVPEEDDTCVCGAARCVSGQLCCEVSGGQVTEACVLSASDEEHCGECGNTCSGGEECRGGGCVCQAGFADCDGESANGCEVAVASDRQNCGGCGNSCVAGEVCSQGLCRLTCQVGQTNCDGSCVNLSQDTRHCGACDAACPGGEICDGTGQCDVSCQLGLTECSTGCYDIYSDRNHCGTCSLTCPSGLVCDGHGGCAISCQPGFTSCDGSCYDLDASGQNCGACGVGCPAGEVCNGEGQCAPTCLPGYTDCGGSCVPLDSNWANCGTCFNACGRGEQCSAGQCVVACQGGQLNCGGRCTDVASDNANCGSCGNACPAGTTCAGGQCEAPCPADTTFCGMACVDVTSDDEHCGSCGNACGMDEFCLAGSCVLIGTCSAGLTSCGAGCFDTDTSYFHCGLCNNNCAVNEVCQGGSCTCTAGWDRCGGNLCLTNLNNSLQHCGSCGNSCGDGQTCVNGSCACGIGRQDCDGDPTTCEAFLTSDESNCGACGTSCATGERCIAGACVEPFASPYVNTGDYGGARCAVVPSTGAVECVGIRKLLGQIGFPYPNTYIPENPQGLDGNSGTAVQVTGSEDHVCAILSDGEMRCWGDDFNGERGCGMAGCTNAPNQVVGLDGSTADSSVVQAGAGTGLTCALLANDGVKCWGRDNDEQLGNGAGQLNQDQPGSYVTNLDGTTSIAQLVVGSRHACVLTTGGAVLCWGAGDSTGTSSSTDSAVPINPTGLDGTTITIEKLATTGDNTCALGSMGELYCWGPGSSYGATPAVLPFFDGRYSLVDIGSGFCATTDVGEVYCFPLFDCNNPINPEPALLPGGNLVTRVQGNTATEVSSGTVMAWGPNDVGQLALPSNVNRRSPVEVLGVVNAVDVAIGNGSIDKTTACAVSSTGTVQCWGEDYGGTPTAVAGVSDATAVAFSNGQGCVVETSGAITCWSRSGVTPLAPFDGMMLSADDVTAGGFHKCITATDGSLHCWGSNFFGQLGDGNTVDLTVPAQVVGFDGVNRSAVDVAAGKAHTCAIDQVGALWCWGDNSTSQLGDGGVVSSSSTPMQVPGYDGTSKSAIAVGAGENHTCAVLSTGAVECWGDNSNRQSSEVIYFQTPIDSPRLVAHMDGQSLVATDVAAVSTSTCALMNDNRVVCWGLNTFGQNGSSSNVDPKYVDQIDGNTIAAEELIGAPESSSTFCVRLTDGRAWCWGKNDVGQVGDGTIIEACQPTATGFTR